MNKISLAAHRTLAPMKRSVRNGFIGITVISLLTVVALQLDRLPFLASGSVYQAIFDDAGGLNKMDSVEIAGVKIGTVQDISLVDTKLGKRVEVRFSMNDTIRVGALSQATIMTETVLGRRSLAIVPRSGSKLRPGSTIENEQTIAPYSLNDALDGLGNTAEETNTDQVNQALTTLSDTFSHTPMQVRAAVDGVSRLSKAIAERDNSLRELFARSHSVTSIIGNRSAQLQKLTLDANSLLGELQAREQALGELLSGLQNVMKQISLAIQENNVQLTSTLEKMRRSLKIVNDNRAALTDTLKRIGPFAIALGETVASGPYWQGFIGIPTLGDYTNVFLKIFERQYPEAFLKLISVLPRLLLEKDRYHDPRATQTAPKPRYPKAGD